MSKDSRRFSRLFPSKPIIGTVHLKPLPGAPAYEGDMRQILDHALRDVDAYERGGCDGLIVENFFDSPFFKDQVGPETVAAIARIAAAIRQRTSLPIGINVLRNDAMSGLAVATACDCQFIRVNQLSWAMLADQGILEGKAAQVLRYRRFLQSDVLIFADCLTKHAVSLALQAMDLVAMDTWERGGADALIISGVATGKETDYNDVLAARKGAPEAPLLIGSGTTTANLKTFLPVVDGFIVGTAFKIDAQIDNPVDVSRVEEMVRLKKSLEPA